MEYLSLLEVGIFTSGFGCNQVIKNLPIPAGIIHESTQFAASGAWYDCNNIRFRTGRAESIGGWSRDGMYELDGLGRASFTSRDYNGNNYQFVGTDRKFYVINGTRATDITPVASTETVTGADLFTSLGGENALVKITDASHGLSVNDWVVFSGVTGGSAPTEYPDALMNQYEGFQIFSIDDADNFTIYVVDASTGLPVTSSSTASWVTDYTIYRKVASGLSSQVAGQGFGAGAWGGEGTPTTYSLSTLPDLGVGSVVAFTGTGGALTATMAVPVTGGPTVTSSSSFYFLAMTGSGPYRTEQLTGHWWNVTSAVSVVTGSDGNDYNTFTIEMPVTLAAGYRIAIASTNPAKEIYFGASADGGDVAGATRGWGDSSSTAELTGEIRRVFIDNYGEDIMLANSGGPIYYYDISANTSSGIPTEPIGSTYTAEALEEFSGSAETPSIVDSFLISKKDGHCVALGCNDIGVTSPINAMLVRWSDQNNPFDWGPSATNTSGGQVLRSGSRILGGLSTKDEVVIFTDHSVYSMRFIGPPDVFSFNLITEGVEIVDARTAVNASNAVFFMGNDGFYVYTGSVQPLPCPVANYVFDDFNAEQKQKCFGAVNSAFSEVIWFYPSSDSFEADSYVTFNYDEKVWSYGKMDMSALSQSAGSTTSLNRTSWRDAIVFGSPMATYVKDYTPETSTTPLIEKSAVSSQETGNSAFGEALASYIESGDISISDGEKFAFISRYIPDIEVFNASASGGAIEFKLNTRDWPGEASTNAVTDQISPAIIDGSQGRGATYTAGTGNASAIRARGRSISVRYENSTASNFRYRLGNLRIDMRMDGRR